MQQAIPPSFAIEVLTSGHPTGPYSLWEKQAAGRHQRPDRGSLDELVWVHRYLADTVFEIAQHPITNLASERKTLVPSGCLGAWPTKNLVRIGLPKASFSPLGLNCAKHFVRTARRFVCAGLDDQPDCVLPNSYQLVRRHCWQPLNDAINTGRLHARPLLLGCNFPAYFQPLLDAKTQYRRGFGRHGGYRRGIWQSSLAGLLSRVLGHYSPSLQFRTASAAEGTIVHSYSRPDGHRPSARRLIQMGEPSLRRSGSH